MTATPIPRTLLLANYGDMDVSRLDEKPAGRKPIMTRVVPSTRLDEVVSGIGRTINTGAQVYWVCPLVEESEKLDLTSAEQRFSHLQKVFAADVGLVHGKMPAAEKDQIMRGFIAGRIKILVATTVIEVGVNVPNATVMVIEHAERFGLSQLHQLRGRVGRGDAQSSCIMLYHGRLSQNSRARLNIMRETEDGFRIAEEDLKLRGGGEILGSRQSGSQNFRVAKFPEHADLLRVARDDTKLIISSDPGLQSQRGKALKQLLYLFERDEAVSLLRAG
jgi:ATP-dependent DNA helicase RecG